MKKLLLCFLGFHLILFPRMRAFELEEGFVTFATKNYFPLLQVLLDSIKAFSSRSIIAYGINDDIPFSTTEYPFLIKKRIDVDLQKEHIFCQKSRIIRDCNIKYGIYVEADDIVNKGVDSLFNFCKSIDQFPLCPIHPQDPNNQQSIMKLFKVTKKSMPYVHGHVLFSYSCSSFINEWHSACQQHITKCPAYDETLLNVLLWKHKATGYLDVFDPYFDSIHAYLENRIPTEHGYKAFHNIKYFMLHGCKDPKKAAELLQLLIRINS